MTRPDLQATQPLTTAPGYRDDQTELAPTSRGGGAAGFLLRALLVLLVVCLGFVAAALLVTPTRESVLILGSDARPDEIAQGVAGRTDTLLLYVADRATPRLALLSVPRDLWVSIPGYGEERINAAYEFGGGDTAKQTVSNVLGQRVDRVVVVGLQGVRDVVDAVGGVDIDVPYAIHDDTYPTDDYGYQTVDFKPGLQHMDGNLALEYARTRHADSDFARAARQQQVLAAVRNAMLNPLNWPRAPVVASAMLGSIKTDVSPLDVIAIGAATLRARGQPDHLVIDTTLVNEVTGADGAYLLEPRPEMKPAVARFLTGTSAATVEVLNGAGVSGLAARTADKLTQAGFVVASVGDAPRSQSQTTIAARPGANSAAQQVATTLGVSPDRISTSANLSTADVQIILGTDSQTSQLRYGG